MVSQIHLNILLILAVRFLREICIYFSKEMRIRQSFETYSIMLSRSILNDQVQRDTLSLFKNMLRVS